MTKRTISKRFNLSDEDSSTSFSGVNFCVISKEHNAFMDKGNSSRFRLSICSCQDTVYLCWNKNKKCLKDVDVIIKALNDYIVILNNGIDGTISSVNRLRKIDNEYWIRMQYFKHRKISAFKIVSPKFKLAGTCIKIEKTLVEFHSDEIYDFIDIYNAHSVTKTKQVVQDSGLSGLRLRLAKMCDVLHSFKQAVEICDN
jgi:hypothetical protein